MNSILQRLLPLNRLALLAGVALAVCFSEAHGQIVPLQLGGNTSYDGWNDLTRSSYSGFTDFPGTSNWPRSIDSKAPGSGDGEMTRLAIAADETGGPFPADESLYFFSYLQVPNALGGTLRVSDATPVAGVKTVALQIQIGEADGYDFPTPSGAPVLRINGQSVGRASMTPVPIASFQNGTYFSPETEEEEPVYVNTWGFQWDVSSLGTITSIQIDFSAVTHAQIYAMRLDQSSQAYATSVFDGGGSTETRVIALSGSLGFGNVVIGSSATRTLTITNNGDSALNVTGISYPSAVFSGNWTGSIPAGGSQTVAVTFTPATATTYSGNLTVDSDATSGTSTLPLNGTGLSQTRIIGISGSLAFGNLEVGQRATRTMTISNTGNSVLTVNSITYPTGFTGNWSGGTIAVGSSRSVTVTFAPTAAISYGSNITVNSNRTSGTDTISTSGTGTITPTSVIELTGDLNFGDVTVNTSSTRTLTIHNRGNSTLNVTGISHSSTAFSGSWSGNIIADGSQEVVISFTPTDVQAYGGIITVNSSNATDGSNVIAVSGAGVVAPTSVIAFEPQLDFGECPFGAARSIAVTIRNTGNAAFELRGLNCPEGFSFKGRTGTVGPGESRNLNIVFEPNAVRPFSGSIIVDSTAQIGGNTIEVTGRAVAPAMRMQVRGTPQFNGEQTEVTHRFVSTAATYLQIEYSENLTDSHSWTALESPVYSEDGTFDVTFSRSGDHQSTWSRGMYFRLIYQK